MVTSKTRPRAGPSRRSSRRLKHKVGKYNEKYLVSISSKDSKLIFRFFDAR